MNELIFVIKCCNSVYRSVVINDGFSDHAGNSLATGVAPMSTRPHNTRTLTTVFFKHCETSGDVLLDCEAAARAALPTHHNDGLLLTIIASKHLKTSY
jgi:hypothetical protein